MATITSKYLIDDIIANNGIDVHPLEEGERPDPDVAMVVEYTTPEGNTVWGVTWVNEPGVSQVRYLVESQFVINPIIIWRKK
jgi:hypothetical protein